MGNMVSVCLSVYLCLKRHQLLVLVSLFSTFLPHPLCLSQSISLLSVPVSCSHSLKPHTYISKLSLSLSPPVQLLMTCHGLACCKFLLAVFSLSSPFPPSVPPSLVSGSLSFSLSVFHTHTHEHTYTNFLPPSLPLYLW